MFITVKYGEKEEAIFNPACRSVSLLSVIRDHCFLNRHVDLELSDENGQVKNLRDKPQSLASEVLREREVLVLLKVNSCSPQDDVAMDYPKYTPLLNDEDAISEAFLAQLASRSVSRPPSRRARSNTSQGRRTPVGRSSSNRAPAPAEPAKKEGVNGNSGDKGSNSGSSISKKNSKSSDGRTSRTRSKASAKKGDS